MGAYRSNGLHVQFVLLAPQNQASCAESLGTMDVNRATRPGFVGVCMPIVNLAAAMAVSVYL
jgi:hypothetical protein